MILQIKWHKTKNRSCIRAVLSLSSNYFIDESLLLASDATKVYSCCLNADKLPIYIIIGKIYIICYNEKNNKGVHERVIYEF